MKLIVAGSRSIKDCSILEKELSNYNPDLIICGGAKGIDRCAILYAETNHIPYKVFYPNYTMFGKIAPLERNSKMAAYGNELLAIWDGKSRGTIHMVREMKNLGKPFKLIDLSIINGKPREPPHRNPPKETPQDVAVS